MTRRGLVLFALMSLIWGIPYLFIRIAVAEMPPTGMAFGRTVIAAAILLPIALLRTDLRLVLARWRWVVAFATIEFGLPWVLLGAAEQRVSSSLAGLLIAGVPLVGATIAFLTRGIERVGRAELMGLLVGLAGVAAIAGADFRASDAIALVQLGAVVVCYAVGPFILSRRLAGLPSLGVMAVSFTLCALAYLPFAVLQWPAIPPGDAAIASVVVLGVVCTATALLIFAALIREIGPVRATVITYVNPVVAAVLGVLILDETITPGMGLGFGLVIVGSALATRPRRARTPAPG